MKEKSSKHVFKKNLKWLIDRHETIQYFCLKINHFKLIDGFFKSLKFISSSCFKTILAELSLSQFPGFHINPNLMILNEIDAGWLGMQTSKLWIDRISENSFKDISKGCQSQSSMNCNNCFNYFSEISTLFGNSQVFLFVIHLNEMENFSN